MFYLKKINTYNKQNSLEKEINFNDIKIFVLSFWKWLA